MSLNPREALDTMLGHLGFISDIRETADEHGVHLQVYTAEKDRLIGKEGELLEDIQLLLNRVLQARDKTAPKVQVDIEHYRTMKEDGLVQKVKQLAVVVRQTGRAYQLEPMNAYERRIIHNAFKDDPDVLSWSPPDESRIKRITLKRRPNANE